MSFPDLAAARAWAVECHGDQRYGEHPYVVHLAAAVAVLGEFGVSDPEIVAATWLHDAVEDTPATVEQVASRFGDRVAAMVAAVSDGDGDTRADRKNGTYRRIAATDGATRVKLADRIANVRACYANGSHKLAMYRSEYPRFRGALRHDAVDGSDASMWDELDGLLGWRT